MCCCVAVAPRAQALRLLNAEAMVERTGRGGRADPFSYRQLP